ncbi:hypothetical protein Btru_045348 [Bulinus truncatus]|nr:hypothetical protein Btru_045348 [Bulinus truncatus]
MTPSDKSETNVTSELQPLCSSFAKGCGGSSNQVGVKMNHGNIMGGNIHLNNASNMNNNNNNNVLHGKYGYSDATSYNEACYEHSGAPSPSSSVASSAASEKDLMTTDSMAPLTSDTMTPMTTGAGYHLHHPPLQQAHHSSHEGQQHAQQQMALHQQGQQQQQHHHHQQQQREQQHHLHHSHQQQHHQQHVNGGAESLFHQDVRFTRPHSQPSHGYLSPGPPHFPHHEIQVPPHAHSQTSDPLHHHHHHSYMPPLLKHQDLSSRNFGLNVNSSSAAVAARHHGYPPHADVNVKQEPRDLTNDANSSYCGERRNLGRAKVKVQVQGQTKLHTPSVMSPPQSITDQGGDAIKGPYEDFYYSLTSVSQTGNDHRLGVGGERVTHVIVVTGSTAAGHCPDSTLAVKVDVTWSTHHVTKHTFLVCSVRPRRCTE